MKPYIKAVSLLLFALFMFAVVQSGIQALNGKPGLINVACLTAVPIGAIAGAYYALRRHRGQAGWERVAMVADCLLSSIVTAVLISTVIGVMVPLTLIPAIAIQAISAAAGALVTFTPRYRRSFFTASW